METEKMLPLLEKGLSAKQGRLANLAKRRVAASAFRGSGLEENGLRNLLDVAKDSNHVAIVTNFLRYQVGRDAGPSPSKWAAIVTYDEESMAIGEWVADDIEHTIARDLATEVLKYV